MNRLLIVLAASALAAASWLPATWALAPEGPALSLPATTFACLVTAAASLALGAWTQAHTEDGPGGAASAGAAVTCAAWSFGAAPVLAAVSQAAVISPVQSAPDAQAVLVTALATAVQSAMLYLLPATALTIPIGAGLGWLGGRLARPGDREWIAPRVVTALTSAFIAAFTPVALVTWHTAALALGDAISQNAVHGEHVLPLSPARAVAGAGDAVILVTGAAALAVLGLWLRTRPAVAGQTPRLLLLGLAYVPYVVVPLALAVPAAVPGSAPVAIAAALGGACLAMGLPLRASTPAPPSPAGALQLVLICAIALNGPGLLDAGLAVATGAVQRIVDLTAFGSLAPANTTLVPELVTLMRLKALGSLVSAATPVGLLAIGAYGLQHRRET